MSEKTDDLQWPGEIRPWPTGFPPVVTQTTLADLYAAALQPGEEVSEEGRSTSYVAAKAGDSSAAKRVVVAVIQPSLVLKLGHEFPGAAVVSVHAEEATGRNKLPIAYATAIGDIAGLDVEDTIVQANRVHHTGSSARQRLARRPTFAGPVRAGRDYLLVDDVVTSGSSLAALRHYIEARGGRVLAATTLASAPPRHGMVPTRLAVSVETVEKILSRFDGRSVDAILRTYGVAPSVHHLTESEGRAVLGFASTDALRSSLASAR